MITICYCTWICFDFNMFPTLEGSVHVHQTRAAKKCSQRTSVIRGPHRFVLKVPDSLIVEGYLSKTESSPGYQRSASPHFGNISPALRKQEKQILQSPPTQFLGIKSLLNRWSVSESTWHEDTKSKWDTSIGRESFEVLPAFIHGILDIFEYTHALTCVFIVWIVCLSLYMPFYPHCRAKISSDAFWIAESILRSNRCCIAFCSQVKSQCWYVLM